MPLWVVKPRLLKDVAVAELYYIVDALYNEVLLRRNGCRGTRGL